MTSLGFPVGRLPSVLARVAAAPTSPAPRGPRHAAPEVPGPVGIVAAEAARSGRHAEPEWSRAIFDPRRDEDPFEWLGFTA
jgi:hypothetical protein